METLVKTFVSHLDISWLPLLFHIYLSPKMEWNIENTPFVAHTNMTKNIWFW